MPPDVRIEGLPGLPSGMVTEGMDIIIRVRRAGSAEASANQTSGPRNAGPAFPETPSLLP